jgi:hypothetical protein
MTKERTRLVCVDWGDQRCDSVEVKCEPCGTPLAMDAANSLLFDQENLMPICVHCLIRELRENGDAIWGGGLVGGRLIEDPEQAIEAARMRAKRVPS